MSSKEKGEGAKKDFEGRGLDLPIINNTTGPVAYSIMKIVFCGIISFVISILIHKLF